MISKTKFLGLEPFREILDEYTSSNNSTDILVKDLDPKATLNKLTIKSSSDSSKQTWIACEPDKMQKKSGRMSLLFSRKKDANHNQACDLFIIYLDVESENLIFLFAELKSSDSTNSISKAKKQLQSTRQFARYLNGLVKEFYPVNNFKTEEKFIVFVGSNYQNKAPTSTRPKKISNDPKNPTIKSIKNESQIFLKQLIQ